MKGVKRMPTRMTICDMNRNKVCELYDSELQHEGQAYDVTLSSAAAGRGGRAGAAPGAGGAGNHCTAILSRPDTIPNATVSIWQTKGRSGDGAVYCRRILHWRNLPDPTNGIPERPPIGAPDRRMATRADVKRKI